MLNKKLLAGIGLVGALLVGATTDASANPWRPRVYSVPAYRPIYRAPVYPVYQPVYRPVYQPVYRAPVVVYAPPPVYVPAYRPVVWHHHHGWNRVVVRAW